MDCTCVVEDRDLWRAPVGTVMNLRVPLTVDNLKTHVIKPRNAYV